MRCMPKNPGLYLRPAQHERGKGLKRPELFVSRKNTGLRGRKKVLVCRTFLSGASRDRTGDLLLAKQALSQLSYGPFGVRV
jgi:hypothetical protein